MDHHLGKLLGVDWTAGCSKDYFCFNCSVWFCAHCCLHGDAHHPNPRWPPPAIIKFIGGAPAMRAEDARGSGYHTSGIHRIKPDQRKWIPIIPQNPQDHRHMGECNICNRRVRKDSLYCSISCRLTGVPKGARRDMAQHLVDTASDFGHHIHLPDRFCTLCCKGFCSDSCPDHLHHHHPQAATAEVIEVEHVEGWPAVEQGLLPAHFVEQVQELHLDGRVLYPVRPRAAHHAALVDPQAHPCNRPNCPQLFLGTATFCSLSCRHEA